MSLSRVRLLVSVRDAAEAQAALAGGADWIDLKEPRRGALGAVDPTVADEIVRRVAGRAPTSAAAGELLQWSGESAGRALLKPPEISHLKLGLAHCQDLDWRPLWDAARDEIVQTGKQLVAVAYADARDAHSPPPEEILEHALARQCAWVLWDTSNKSAGSLEESMGMSQLSSQLEAVRAGGARTVVAGRLDGLAIGRLPLELVDMVGVRSAACRGGRDSQVCAERVAALDALLTRHADCSAAASL